MEKGLIKNISRWVGIIPIAVLSFVLGGVVSNIFFAIQRWFIGIEPDSGYAKINFYIFSSAISAGASVYFGSRTAPSHRKVVSMVLAALIVGVSVLSIIGAVMTQDNVIWTILSAIAAVIASGYMVYNFFEIGEEFSMSN